PQRRARADASLERDVRPGDTRRKLEHLTIAPAFFVFLLLQRHLDAGAFTEAAERHVEDCRERERSNEGERTAGVKQANDEIVVEHRIVTQCGSTQFSHQSASRRARAVVSVISKALCSRPTRRMTNSKGCDGATPTTASNRPWSRSLAGLFSSSHLTKKA